jgi:hypothetical protein
MIGITKRRMSNVSYRFRRSPSCSYFTNALEGAMKNFTVWFRVGLDFKETIEAEDVRDAQRRLEDKVDDSYPDYVAQIADDPITFIYDIVEGES